MHALHPLAKMQSKNAINVFHAHQRLTLHRCRLDRGPDALPQLQQRAKLPSGSSHIPIGVSPSLVCLKTPHVSNYFHRHHHQVPESTYHVTTPHHRGPLIRSMRVSNHQHTFAKLEPGVAASASQCRFVFASVRHVHHVSLAAGSPMLHSPSGAMTQDTL